MTKKDSIELENFGDWYAEVKRIKRGIRSDFKAREREALVQVDLDTDRKIYDLMTAGATVSAICRQMETTNRHSVYDAYYRAKERVETVKQYGRQRLGYYKSWNQWGMHYRAGDKDGWVVIMMPNTEDMQAYVTDNEDDWVQPDVMPVDPSNELVQWVLKDLEGAEDK